MTICCSYCKNECKTVIESGDFYADGHSGTIIGSIGDAEVSECCKEPIFDIDSDLFIFWQDIKEMAKKNRVESIVENDPSIYSDSFERGDSPKETFDNLVLSITGCKQ